MIASFVAYIPPSYTAPRWGAGITDRQVLSRWGGGCSRLRARGGGGYKQTYVRSPRKLCLFLNILSVLHPSLYYNNTRILRSIIFYLVQQWLTLRFFFFHEKINAEVCAWFVCDHHTQRLIIITRSRRSHFFQDRQQQLHIYLFYSVLCTKCVVNSTKFFHISYIYIFFFS